MANVSLQYCKKLPASRDFDFAINPCEETTGDAVVGTFSGVSNCVADMSGRQGLSGVFAAGVPLPTAAFIGECDSNVWRGTIVDTYIHSDVSTWRDCSISCSWEDIEHKRLPKNIEYEHCLRLFDKICVPISTFECVNLWKYINYRGATPRQRSTLTKFVSCWPQNFIRCGEWVDAEHASTELEEQYVSCWPERSFICNPFTKCDTVTRIYAEVFEGSAKQLITKNCSSWKDARHPLLIWPAPDFTPPVPDDKFHGDLELDLRCILPDPLWGNIRFNIGIPNVCNTAGIALEVPKVIIMAHDLWVKLVSTGEIIPCSGINVSSDRDAWGWSWSADLLQQQDSLIETQHAVEINIDGNTWKGNIEQYSGTHTFGSRKYHIGGRSLAAELHSPYVSPRSRNETNTRTFKQLITDEVVDTGWTIEWSPLITDFTVPANTLSYSNKTPMTAIKDIASAIGAIVQAHPYEKKLIIKPKYAVPPWELAAYTPDFTILRGYVLTESVSWNPIALSRGVWVSGSTGDGVRGKIYRQSSDGVPYAPMVVDPLITDMQAAIQRGRQVLSATGKRKDVSIQIPLITTICSVSPGDIILFDDLVDWMGYVDSVSISGNYSKVVQNVGIEHIEEF